MSFFSRGLTALLLALPVTCLLIYEDVRRANRPYFEIDIASTTDGLAQVFFDRGQDALEQGIEITYCKRIWEGAGHLYILKILYWKTWSRSNLVSSAGHIVNSSLIASMPVTTGFADQSS